MASNKETIYNGFTKYKISRYASEFTGTAILIGSIKLILGSGNDSHVLLAPLGIGFTLMMIVYNYGYNSLGMYNPSVTLAHIIRDPSNFQRSDYIQWIMYFIAQFTGGIAGGFFASIIGGYDVCMVHTFVNTEYKSYQALLGEFLYCSILVSLNIHLATDKRVDGNQFYGIGIGTSLFVAILAIGDITGCAINPAVWVGTVTSAAFCDKDKVITEHCWIYWIAHILAGVFGGFWFRLIYGCNDAYGEEEDHDDNVKKRQERKRERLPTEDHDEITEDETDEDTDRAHVVKKVHDIDEEDPTNQNNKETELSPMCDSNN